MTFINNPSAPSEIDNTEEFRQCFYDIFLETKGEELEIWLNGFQRAYNGTLRYFRALRVVDRVVNAVLGLDLTDQCKNSLMRMTHCAHCASFPSSTLTCPGLCLNTLRGCLLDLGDLAEPVRDFSQALVAMEDKAMENNVYDQITLLSSHFFELVLGSSNEFITIREEVSMLV